MKDDPGPCAVIDGLLWNPSQLRVKAHAQYLISGPPPGPPFTPLDAKGMEDRVAYGQGLLVSIEDEVRQTQPEHSDCADCRVWCDRMNCWKCDVLARSIPRCKRHHAEHLRNAHLAEEEVIR
jgi:hypothetical protein